MVCLYFRPLQGNELDKNETISLDVAKELGGKLEPGIYAMTVQAPEYLNKYQNNEKIVEEYFFAVSGTGLTLKYSAKDVLVWATDLYTGKAQKNLKINIFSLDGQLKYSGRTDENGVFNKEADLGRFQTKDNEWQPEFWVTAETADDFAFVASTNNPIDIGRVNLERLFDIAQNSYIDIDGERRAYLTTDEVINLSIGQGSLNAQERLEIESHVTHTYHFLRQIPWTRELRRVPAIAYAHHEKLNGGGYPNQLVGDEILLQSKIMTVCDIYDALTAGDRPYKRALSPEGAIDILRSDCQTGLVDPDLLNLFVEGKIFELTLKQGVAR